MVRDRAATRYVPTTVLPYSGRCEEDARVVRQQRSNGLLLHWRQLSLESVFDGKTVVPDRRG